MYCRCSCKKLSIICRFCGSVVKARGYYYHFTCCTHINPKCECSEYHSNKKSRYRIYEYLHKTKKALYSFYYFPEGKVLYEIDSLKIKVPVKFVKAIISKGQNINNLCKIEYNGKEIEVGLDKLYPIGYRE